MNEYYTMCIFVPSAVYLCVVLSCAYNACVHCVCVCVLKFLAYINCCTNCIFLFVLGDRLFLSLLLLSLLLLFLYIRLLLG